MQNLFWDLLIVIVYFVGITSIGLYMGRKEESMEDFALGGRKIPWWAVLASIIAAETSAAASTNVVRVRSIAVPSSALYAPELYGGSR